MSVHEWLPLALVGVAAAAYTVRQALELMGKSPSANLLREENVDLVRRNRELEETVERHERSIEDLRRKVSELEMTNQKAVLNALVDHEKKAAERYEGHMIVAQSHEALLTRAVTALEGMESKP